VVSRVSIGVRRATGVGGRTKRRLPREKREGNGSSVVDRVAVDASTVERVSARSGAPPSSSRVLRDEDVVGFRESTASTTSVE
jgi:hypothetical protein